MPRPRYRACLEDGLKLDLNHLARKGFIKACANIGPRGISWSNPHQGEIARGVISADMTNPDHAWFRLAIGSFAQQITFFLSLAPLRRTPVVLSLPRDRRTCYGALEAPWSRQVLEQASLGTKGRLCVAISGSRQSRSSRTIKNQCAAVFDRSVRSAGMEVSPETEGDALEDV